MAYIVFQPVLIIKSCPTAMRDSVSTAKGGRWVELDKKKRKEL